MLLPLFDIHCLRLFTSHLELVTAAWAAKGPGHERAGGIDCSKVSNEVSHVSASSKYTREYMTNTNNITNTATRKATFDEPATRGGTATRVGTARGTILFST